MESGPVMRGAFSELDPRPGPREGLEPLPWRPTRRGGRDGMMAQRSLPAGEDLVAVDVSTEITIAERIG